MLRCNNYLCKAIRLIKYANMCFIKCCEKKKNTKPLISRFYDILSQFNQQVN